MGSEVSQFKAVNLKSGLLTVHQALQRLDRELALARRDRIQVVKIIPGYDSTGAGGDIRIAVQKRLLELEESGQIRGCIFGENWAKSDEATWRLLQALLELKSDPDLSRGNEGITIVLI